VKQKLAYAGHVKRGSSGLNALLVLEGKFDGKKRTIVEDADLEGWRDDVIQWMQKKYDEVKRLAEDRDTWRKMTHGVSLWFNIRASEW